MEEYKPFYSEASTHCEVDVPETFAVSYIAKDLHGVFSQEGNVAKTMIEWALQPRKL